MLAPLQHLENNQAEPANFVMSQTFSPLVGESSPRLGRDVLKRVSASEKTV
jgi:hypothetical protein